MLLVRLIGLLERNDDVHPAVRQQQHQLQQ